jgi:Arc/MetJ-type ribon-helix-helix transcriptional regulator
MDNPNAPTMLSVRIPKYLRDKLEDLREALSRKSGKQASTSDALRSLLDDEDGRASQITEEARAHENPTEYLAEVGHIGLAGGQLSFTAWQVQLHYIKVALSTDHLWKWPISLNTAKQLTAAFIALHKKYREKKIRTELDSFLLMLVRKVHPRWMMPAKSPEIAEEVEKGYQTLYEAFDTLDPKCRNYYACNAVDALQLLLESDKRISSADLNDTLLPYWNELWAVTARGHYLTKKKPIRSSNFVPAPSSFVTKNYADGPIRISASLEYKEHDLLTICNFIYTPDIQMMFDVSTYPKIIELLRILEDAEKTPKYNDIKGFEYTLTTGDDFYTLRYTDIAGINMSLAKAEWKRVIDLYREIISSPEITPEWERFKFEYGEI